MMKAVQFTIDEQLLRRLDLDPEVRRSGRSAFLRQAVRDRLSRRRREAIRDAYKKGYGERPVTEDEFGPMIEAQSWPEE